MKKILLAIFCATLLLVASVSVSAYSWTWSRPRTVSVYKLTVDTDKSEYDVGEMVQISGKVTYGRWGTRKVIGLTINDEHGAPVFVDQKMSNRRGEYSFTLQLPQEIPYGRITHYGDYQVYVAASRTNTNAQTTFTIIEPEPSIEEELCIEDWTCTEWSECTGDPYDSWKYRTCTDNNNCGTTDDKPSESESCYCYSGWQWENDTIDIGNPSSEDGHNLFGWGPIQPLTDGGLWGKHSTGSSCCPYGSWAYPNAFDGSLRVVDYSPKSTNPYEQEATGGTGNHIASFNVDFGGDGSMRYDKNEISFWVLKGMKPFNDESLNDSFQVFVDGILAYDYQDDGVRGEWCDQGEWIKHEITHTTLCNIFPCNSNHVWGNRTILFTSTGPYWTGYSDYGQIGVSRFESKWRHSTIICS